MADDKADQGRSDETRDLRPHQKGQILHFRNLQIGSLFAGRYRVETRLGAGGSGEVFKVHDTVADQCVALKVLFPGGGEAEQARLRRELQSLRSLSHPGVLRVFDIGEHDGFSYIVTEYLEGETLRDYLGRHGRLSHVEVKRIVEALLEALAEAHRAGIVHRDVKPGNIFLARSPIADPPRVVLLDFGLARSETSHALTAVGRFLGTPEYCSPEQVQSAADVGPPSDLYSVGITLWEMLAGAPPFTGDSEIEVLTSHLAKPVPPINKAFSDVPRDLRELVLRLLEKDPKRRPRDAVAALEIVRAGGFFGAWFVELRYMLQRRRRFGHLVTALSLVLVVLIIVAGWLSTPIEVKAEDRHVVWTTRSGRAISYGPFEQTIHRAVMEDTGFGPLRGTWLMLTNPDGRLTPNSPMSRNGVALYYSKSPLLRYFLRQPYHEADTNRALYPNQCMPYNAQWVIPLAGWAKKDEPRLLQTLQQSPNYPSRVVARFTEDTVFHYDHPGTFSSYQRYRDSHSGRLMLIAGGLNNLLGPRLVVAGIAITHSASGQAPPYILDPKVTGAAGGWYLPLMYTGRTTGVAVRTTDEGMTAEVTGEREIPFDPSSGIPLRAVDRDELSAQAWDHARAQMLDALLEAGWLRSAHKAEKAAEHLEQAASKLDRPRSFAAILLYRAALLRMEDAQAHSRPAYEAALSDIETALLLEPEPSRVNLLKAELLGRIGETSRLAEELDSWHQRSSHPMHLYEVMLAAWLSGSSEQTKRLDARIRALTPGPWLTIARMSSAVLAGDPRSALDLYATIPPAIRPSADYDLPHYWAARAALMVDPPDTDRALELAQRTDNAACIGTYLPTQTLRTRALVLSGIDRPGNIDFAPLIAELDHVEHQSFTSIEALIYHALTARDLALLARQADRPDLVARFTQAYEHNPFTQNGALPPLEPTRFAQ